VAYFFDRFRGRERSGSGDNPPEIGELWRFDPDPPQGAWAKTRAELSPSSVNLPERYSQFADLARAGDNPAEFYDEPGRVEGWRYRLETIRLQLFAEINRSLQRELAVGNGFNFVPVVFALGIIAYFQAAAEPLLSAVAAAFVCFTVLALRMKSRGGTFYACVALTLFCGGMGASKLQVMHSATPVPLSQITGQIRGRRTGSRPESARSAALFDQTAAHRRACSGSIAEKDQIIGQQQA